MWYTTATGAADPAEWSGGDFLPRTYQHAASCACSGCASTRTGTCNRLWALDLPVTSCVRTALLRAHKALPAAFKRFVRANASDVDAYVKTFYDMHEAAYHGCCCPGKPAALWAWKAVFLAGSLLPCGVETDAILEAGRCGCGW